MITPALFLWLNLCCAVYDVEPEFALSVFTIESRLEVGPLGRSGTYIGPAGIHKCFRAKYDIDDPKENIRVGVAALRGKDKFRVLHRYNPKATPAYVREVMRLRKQLGRKG